MKAKVSPKAGKRASTIIMALVIATVLCLSVTGYLSLVEQQNFLSARSQSWNMAIAVVEAGIEEALTQLNSNTTNLTADGWAFDGATYSRTRNLPGGNSYTVTIDATTDPLNPSIVSRAYVNSPIFAQNSTPNYFAQVGQTQGTMPSMTRAVRATASRGALFTKAMVAKRTINLNGNNIATDSFDSTNPKYSTNGQYDPSKVRDNGDVASNDTITDSISVGNANIYGHVATGPGGTVYVGSNGGIGEHSWQANNGGIEPGGTPPWLAHNSNFTFPDTSLPNSSGYLTPTSGNVAVLNTTVTSTSTNSSVPPPGGGPVVTNIVSTTTVTTYPNPVPIGLTTNITQTTSSTYPAPAPAAGVTTNTVMVNGSLTLPNPAPIGSVTNLVWVNNSATLPSPVPSGTTTNDLTTSTTSTAYPSPGTYVGTVVTTVVKDGQQSGRGTWYTFNLITGYSYNYPTVTYNYPTYTFTYPTYTYTYPTYSYTYNLYTTNTAWATNHYDYICNTGNYVASSLSGATIVLGQATLVLPNGLNMSGKDSFTIAPSGSVTVYSGGNSCAIGGNGVINQPGYAADFILYAAPTVTSFSFSGNGGFSGVLVAPNAAMTMNGGGNNVTDFIGCCIVDTVTMNGHFHFHYDESLGRVGGNGRYLLTSWNEIP